MMNYGYTIFAKHVIIKLKCNLLHCSTNTLIEIFPSLQIGNGRKENSFIIQGVLPVKRMDEFREELNKRMIQYKISKLQEQLNEITKSSYAMTPEPKSLEEKFDEMINQGEYIL